VTQREILRQFRGAWDMHYGPPLYISPAQDWLWVCFEVLETTNNSTEEALVGSKFFFPEGFSFSNLVTSRRSAWVMLAVNRDRSEPEWPIPVSRGPGKADEGHGDAIARKRAEGRRG
jgi:hypothetical protein